MVKTVILGATLEKDPYDRVPVDRKGRVVWKLPEPVRREPHWKNEWAKRTAEAQGLDRMTAGAQYTFMVSVYTGASAKVYNSMKNKARRNRMGRWSN